MKEIVAKDLSEKDLNAPLGQHFHVDALSF